MSAVMYANRHKPGIYRIVKGVGVNMETAYAMMLMTAALMDLQPEDEEVVHIILHDCGVEDE